MDELRFTMTTEFLFAVPLFIVSVDNYEENNRRIEAEFLASIDSHRRSHLEEGRYENTFVDIGRVPSVESILRLAETIGTRIAGQDVEVVRDGTCHAWWFNEAKPDESTSLHNHAPGLLSGVYYVKTPPGCGAIVFSRRMSQHGADCESAFFQDIAYAPKEGSVLIFPAWLDHGVFRNETQANRLSVAFNLSLRSKQQATYRIERPLRPGADNA
jgi:hypothetical protein